LLVFVHGNSESPKDVTPEFDVFLLRKMRPLGEFINALDTCAACLKLGPKACVSEQPSQLSNKFISNFQSPALQEAM
jgi:hypothetical protein